MDIFTTLPRPGVYDAHLVAVGEEADVPRARELLRPPSQRSYQPVADPLVRLAGKAEAFVAVGGPAHEHCASPVGEAGRTCVVGPGRRAARTRLDPVAVLGEPGDALELEHRHAVEA